MTAERIARVKIEAYQDDGGWCARGIDEDIFTHAPTIDELFRNINEAVELHFQNSGQSRERETNQ